MQGKGKCVMQQQMVNPSSEIAALDKALLVVGRARCELVAGTELDRKVGRVREYLMLRQNILLMFVMVESNSPEVRR